MKNDPLAISQLYPVLLSALLPQSFMPRQGLSLLDFWRDEGIGDGRALCHLHQRAPGDIGSRLGFLSL
jgi:hypothetical protein